MLIHCTSLRLAFYTTRQGGLDNGLGFVIPSNNPLAWNCKISDRQKALWRKNSSQSPCVWVMLAEKIIPGLARTKQKHPTDNYEELSNVLEATASIWLFLTLWKGFQQQVKVTEFAEYRLLVNPFAFPLQFLLKVFDSLGEKKRQFPLHRQTRRRRCDTIKSLLGDSINHGGNVVASTAWPACLPTNERLTFSSKALWFRLGRVVAQTGSWSRRNPYKRLSRKDGGEVSYMCVEHTSLAQSEEFVTCHNSSKAPSLDRSKLPPGKPLSILLASATEPTRHGGQCSHDRLLWQKFSFLASNTTKTKSARYSNAEAPDTKAFPLNSKRGWSPPCLRRFPF